MGGDGFLTNRQTLAAQWEVHLFIFHSNSTEKRSLCTLHIAM